MGIFENFNQNRNFLNFDQIFTKIEIFENFYHNRDYSKIEIFRNFKKKTGFFLKILTKIKICETFHQNWDFVNIFAKIKDFQIFLDSFYHNQDFRKFLPKSWFSNIFTKIEIFQNCDQSRYLSNIETTLENFHQYRDFENWQQNWNFL